MQIFYYMTSIFDINIGLTSYVRTKMELPEEIVVRPIKRMKINSMREKHLWRIKCHVMLGSRVVSSIVSAYSLRMDRLPEVSRHFRFTFIRESENDAGRGACRRSMNFASLLADFGGFAR